jgi:REP element-mobilizing transposase RayT
MSNVTFQYEVTDRMGKTIYSAWKTIQMSNAPTQELVFNDGDFTWQANRSIIYNFLDDSYFVRTVNDSPVEPIENYATMFEELGWKV